MPLPIEGATLRLRYPRLTDFLVWVGAFEDWPKDQLGEYTINRGIIECTKAVRANKAVTEPLTDNSAWVQTILIELLDGTPVGLHRAQAKGKSVMVLNQAFLPEQRGKGYFDELQTLLQKYLFDVLKGEAAKFELLPESAGALAHVTGREKFEDTGTVVGTTGKVLPTGVLTRAAWEKDEAKKEGPAETGPGGVPLSGENEEFAPVTNPEQLP